MLKKFTLTLFLLLLASATWPLQAHQSKIVGNDKYRVSVGFIQEPIFTEHRNGLDLIIRSVAEREPVLGLENDLFAEIIGPDGKTTRQFPIRPQYGSPGRYTFDIVLTEAGQYQVRVWGNIEGEAFDETFSLDEVTAIREIYFPAEQG